MVQKIYIYVTRLFKIFGFNSCESSFDDISLIQPNEQQSSFEIKNKEIPVLCDNVNNEILPNSRVQIEDQSENLNFRE